MHGTLRAWWAQQNSGGDTFYRMQWAKQIQSFVAADHAVEVVESAWTDLMLHSTLGSHMSITQQLLSSSHNFQVGFQGLLGRAEALLCLRPKDLDLRVEVHFDHLKDRLSLPAMSQLVIYR